MKKLLKLAAVFAAFALMFGFASCNDSDDEGDSGNSDTTNPGGDNGGSDDEGDGEYTGEPTTDSWDFTTYSEAVWVNPDAAGSTVQKDATKYDQDGTYTLSADATVKGASDVLTLTVTKDGTNKGTSQSTVNYSYQAGTTDGLRLKNDALKIADVKGKVMLKIEWSCIKNKPANDRKLEVTVGDDGTPAEIGNTATTDATSENVAMTPYEREFDAGSGKNIYIGASNNIFIKTITITKQAAAFTPADNTDTANDLATLGLVGTTVTSSDESIAKAAIADGKIKITPVAAGTATVTVKNADGKEATIAVTVRSSGEISLGNVTKFTREAPKLVDGSKTNANSSTGTKGSAKATWDGLTDLEYSADNETFASATDAGIAAAVEGTTVTVTGLDAGTYYVRGAASDKYEATGVLEVVIGDDGAAKTTYMLSGSDIASFTSTNDDTGKYSDAFKDFFYLVQNGVSYDASKGIKINGSLQGKKNHIKFTTTGTTTVTVTFIQASNDTPRYAKYAPIDGTTLGTAVTGTEGAVKNGDAVTTTFEGLSAGSYAIGGDNGIYIKELKVEVAQ